MQLIKYIKYIPFIIFGFGILFYLYKYHSMKQELQDKEKEIISLNLALTAHEQIIEAQKLNFEKNKKLIFELQTERNDLQAKTKIKQDKLQGLDNDPKISKWSEQKIPKEISEILADF